MDIFGWDPNPMDWNWGFAGPKSQSSNSSLDMGSLSSLATPIDPNKPLNVRNPASLSPLNSMSMGGGAPSMDESGAAHGDNGGWSGGVSAQSFAPAPGSTSASSQPFNLNTSNNTMTNTSNQDPRSLAAQALQTLLGNQQGEQEDLASGRSLRDALLQRIQGMSNPYGQNSEGLQQQLGYQQGAINHDFNNAQAQVMQQLGARGAIGSGQETQALSDLAMKRAEALSGGEAQLRGNFYNQAQGWDQQNLGNQMGAMGMFRGQSNPYALAMAANGYAGLNNTDFNQSQQTNAAYGQAIGSTLQILPLLMQMGAFT